MKMFMLAAVFAVLVVSSAAVSVLWLGGPM
jgi:hypothetical protein